MGIDGRMQWIGHMEGVLREICSQSMSTLGQEQQKKLDAQIKVVLVG